MLRAGAWAARGLRVPSRNALLADVVPAGSYGRAYGFERAMDNLGAIGGPLLALALVALVGVRTAILLSIIPGLLAVGAILYAIRHTPKPTEQAERRLRVQGAARPARAARPVPVGRPLFEAANIAATLLILRATDLLTPEHGHDRAVELAIALYVVYNLAATLVSIPGGPHGDRTAWSRVRRGVACFALAYAGLAVRTGASPSSLSRSPSPGSGSGSSRPPSTPPLPTFAPVEIRGSAFGMLAAIQSFGNLAASAIVGLLYTLVSPSFCVRVRARRSWSSRWRVSSPPQIAPRSLNLSRGSTGGSTG